TASALRREAVGGHLDDGVEVTTFQLAIGPRAPNDVKQIVFGVVAARGFRRDLLREYIERSVVLHDRVELSASYRSQQRRALHEIVSGDRKEPPFRCTADRVAGSADALEKC